MVGEQLTKSVKRVGGIPLFTICLKKALVSLDREKNAVNGLLVGDAPHHLGTFLEKSVQIGYRRAGIFR